MTIRGLVVVLARLHVFHPVMHPLILGVGPAAHASGLAAAP
jgi:hypothetical protein